MTENKALIQSVVFVDGKQNECFYVSTIDRDSSAMYGGRYAETLVWEFDFNTKVRGKLVGQEDDREGSLNGHFRMCTRILETGQSKEI